MKLDTCFAYYAEKCPDVAHRLFFNTYNFNNSATVIILTVKEHLAAWKNFLAPFEHIKLYEVNYITTEAHKKQIIGDKTRNILESNNDFEARTDGFRFLYWYIYPEVFAPYNFVGAISPYLILSYDIPTLSASTKIHRHYKDKNANLFLANKYLFEINKKAICSIFEKHARTIGDIKNFRTTVDLGEFTNTPLKEAKSENVLQLDTPKSSLEIFNTGIIDGIAYNLNKQYTYISIPKIKFLDIDFSGVVWENRLNFCLNAGEFDYYN
jgi:hypothetical protein